MANSKDFTNKVVLITGSSSGIGAFTAIKLSKCGARVVVTGRNKLNLNKVSEQIAKSSSEGRDGVLMVVADLSNDEDCKKLIQSTIEKFGKLDILINNAGLGAHTLISDPKLMENYDKVMNSNLRSVLFMTHLAVPHLEKTKGVIINISSVLGIKPKPAYMIYCMSKSAVDMLTKCLALELGPKGIRVNVINPALIKTNFLNAIGLNDEDKNNIYINEEKKYPLGRIGESEDIANAIAFLASDDASFITGINFVADGGATWTI